MIEATALARTVRADKAKSSSSGHDQYKVGDLIDYFRPISAKDTSGWSAPNGPVPITALKLDEENGNHLWRYALNKEIEMMFRHVPCASSSAV